MGHYSNACDKDATMKTSNKDGSNFLVLKDHACDSSSEDEQCIYKYTPASIYNKLKAVEEEENGDSDNEYNDLESREDEETNTEYDKYEGFAFLCTVFHSGQTRNT